MGHSSFQTISRWRPQCWWHYALLAATVLLALAPCDIPIARFCYRHAPSEDVRTAMEWFEDLAGTGIGVILVLTAALIFSRTKISRVPGLLGVTLGGGLLADIVKISVCRIRPHNLDLSVATFWSTFQGLFPLFSVGSKGQSFPSGHAATAIGLAVALSILYPRGRWFFAALAVAVAVCRVVVHAHFPTDVVAGLMLGGASAYAARRGLSAPLFAWSERKIDDAIARRRERFQPAPDASCSLAVPSPPVGLNTNSDHRNVA